MQEHRLVATEASAGMKVSIIICTHNHLASLRDTLKALAEVRVPAAVEAELLLVENACMDGTAEFVETIRLPHMRCRALHEPRKGQVRARNLGLSAAQGELIIFTDDDVRPQPDWLEELWRAFAEDRSDAFIGAIRLAPHLERPWLTRRLRACLAVSEGLEDGWLTEMIGANMAFRRRVLAKVPRFDDELGPGALGFGDDTLFSWQLETAGFRLVRVPGAIVEHHCDAARLRRDSFLDTARKSGRGRAYLLHHWKHERITFPRLRLLYAWAKLARRWLLSRRETRVVEGCAEWESSLTMEIALCRAYLSERRRRRNYSRRGLVKLPASSPQSPEETAAQLRFEVENAELSAREP